MPPASPAFRPHGGPRFSWKTLPPDIRIGLGLLAALAVIALLSLLLPERGPKLPPLLGQIDRQPPASARPTPTPRGATASPRPSAAPSAKGG